MKPESKNMYFGVYQRALYHDYEATQRRHSKMCQQTVAVTHPLLMRLQAWSMAGIKGS